jgi:hypothetical protein
MINTVVYSAYAGEKKPSQQGKGKGNKKQTPINA